MIVCLCFCHICETVCFALLSNGNPEGSVVGEVLLPCIFKGCTGEQAFVCAQGELPSLSILAHSCMVEGLLSFIHKYIGRTLR